MDKFVKELTLNINESLLDAVINCTIDGMELHKRIQDNQFGARAIQSQKKIEKIQLGKQSAIME